MISLRNDDFRDYQSYYTYFKYGYDGVEISYKFFSNILSGFDLGFYYLLYLFGFFGFSLKISKLYNIYYVDYGGLRFILLFLMYLCGFFFLWDLIQIRFSAAISFLLLALFEKDKKNKFIYYLLSFLFHYSMIIPIVIFYFFYIFKNKILRFLFLVLFPLFIFYISQYSEYALKYSVDNSNYDQTLSLFSGIYFLNFFMIILFYIFRGKVHDLYVDISKNLFTGSLVLMFVAIAISINTPEGANRLISLLTFLLILLFSLVKDKIFNIIYIIFTLFFCYWYLKIYLFKEDSLLPVSGFF